MKHIKTMLPANPNILMMLSFEQYLNQGSYTAKTVKRYTKVATAFLQQNKEAADYTYSDILRHLDQSHQYIPSQHMRLSHFLPIKKYYDYLLETAQRPDHPCRNLLVRAPRKKGVAFTDLFSSLELEQLLEREEKFDLVKTKNLLIVSLLIYQGLLSKEIVQLKLQHLNVDRGQIKIIGGKINAGRTLDLRPLQIELFTRYISTERKLLLKDKKSDVLFINFKGNAISTDNIHSAIETQKGMFPDRALNPKTIRESVIANLLNEKRLPAEQVQLFTGHRWISCTLRYQQIPMNEQRELINRFYPRG